MSNILQPFQLPIYQSYIEEDTFTKIKNDVSFYIEKNQKVFKDGWNSNTKTNINEKNILFKSKTLEKILEYNSIKYSKKWGFKNIQLGLNSYWINVAKKSSFQESHNHVETSPFTNVFSGILYISTPTDCGDLCLESPNTLASSLLPPNNILPQLTCIKPKERMLLLFPSWLGHFVKHNNSNKSRISLSWNIHYKSLN
tara:strand:+ start:314 stop:907 length:594 start_codon:yes stop_codon:yes gene_type:complete